MLGATKPSIAGAKLGKLRRALEIFLVSVRVPPIMDRRRKGKAKMNFTRPAKKAVEID